MLQDAVWKPTARCSLEVVEFFDYCPVEQSMLKLHVALTHTFIIVISRHALIPASQVAARQSAASERRRQSFLILFWGAVTETPFRSHAMPRHKHKGWRSHGRCFGSFTLNMHMFGPESIMVGLEVLLGKHYNTRMMAGSCTECHHNPVNLRIEH